MTWTAATLLAWAGTYVFVAVFYGRLQRLERRREHGLFAGMAFFLALFSAATAWAVEATCPAEATRAQQLQHFGLVPAMAYFTEFLLCLADEPRPRLVLAVRTWAWVGVGAVAAGLFYDPAFADPAYDWGAPTPWASAMAALRPVGAVFMACGVAHAAFATLRVIRHAPRRRDLRAAAFITAGAIASGAAELAVRALGYGTIPMTSHGALLAVLGFSYVLLGRLTEVDRALADRTAELAESYQHLRVAQEELVKKEQLAAVGELSAVIAHEVRNPLAILKNAVAGLRRRELRPRDAETLLTILDDETDRLNRLVRDFLAYAKPIALAEGTVDLRNLVLRAVELAAGGSRDLENVELELEVDRPVPNVEGDETLLRHALINIVDNALQAMPSGGTLTVSCRPAAIDGRACVAVDFHDTGEGMDTLVRTRARDPFFTTRAESTGLGLAIVDRVAKAHGGRVEIESRHGQGTRVSLVVPVDRVSTVPPPP